MPLIPLGGHRSNQGNKNNVYHADYRYYPSLFNDTGKLLVSPRNRNSSAFAEIAGGELETVHERKLSALGNDLTLIQPSRPGELASPSFSLSLGIVVVALIAFVLLLK